MILWHDSVTKSNRYKNVSMDKQVSNQEKTNLHTSALFDVRRGREKGLKWDLISRTAINGSIIGYVVNRLHI